MTHLVVCGKITAHQGRVVDGKLADSYQKLDQWSKAFMRSLVKRAKTPVDEDETSDPTTQDV